MVNSKTEKRLSIIIFIGIVFFDKNITFSIHENSTLHGFLGTCGIWEWTKLNDWEISCKHPTIKCKHLWLSLVVLMYDLGGPISNSSDIIVDLVAV